MPRQLSNGGPPLLEGQRGESPNYRPDGRNGFTQGNSWSAQNNPNDRPALMPSSMGWTRPPDARERRVIATLEQRVRREEEVYEHHFGRIYTVEPSHDAISPQAYIGLLNSRYEFAAGRNATRDAGRAWDLHREQEAGRAINEIMTPRQGTLSVGAYGGREIGDRRSWDRAGERNDADHVPSSGAIRRVYGNDGPSRNEQTSRMIPESMHRDFNRQFPNQDGVGETLYENVQRRNDYQGRQLRERGYSPREIGRSNEAIHDHNNDLGIYNGNRRGREPERR